MGTHRELLERQDVYHRLYQLQYKEQEISVPAPTSSYPEHNL